ncbi:MULTISPECIES: BCD family MFS transporter [Cyanophyceae]|uniref:BCD family MFS transporter n=1 Tax=Cyanophyceae TaxID=3028117 RepID=UPI001685809A|nr:MULTISPECIES: BCD family MFS transporter [Cyanophyceae]MBD1917807.1 BCD family MFS transporter [Phormidium sp. FACHB-77]MBD2032925.1 BCD family MFS transporter [Phormidium sp. FACHB-322]MBD2051673.1 BCD family MFS transporter [Leptolyngbya sp. FACHB-60]
MTSPDVSTSAPGSAAVPKPNLSLLTMLRLGVFNMGLGIMSLLTLGVLNRVMIEELRVPALVAAGAIAVHQFMAPARVWFGQMSDSRPIFGHHRSGYIWLGIVTVAVTAFCALQVVWQIGSRIAEEGWGPAVYPWVGLLGLLFAVYGLALSATSTPFTALLVDVSDEDSRSRLVGIGWAMLMVGIIAGVIITSIVLKPIELNAPFDQVRSAVNRLFVIAPAVVCVLAVVSTYGIERKYSRLTQRSSLRDREDSLTLGRALKILTASRQTGLFFTFLLVLSLSLFMQDAVLEPYGGEVFGMTIAETTQLNAAFGLGTLLSIIVSGWLIVPRLGKKRTVVLGCSWAAVCLVGITLSGLTGSPAILLTAVFLFGTASGILTLGAIVLMLDLTVAETAGTFIGAWGLAQAIARGSATVIGGGVLDLGRAILRSFNGAAEVGQPQAFLAYGLVFTLQAIGMLVAIWLLSRVNIQEFQANAKAAITAAMESDMD